MAKVYTWAFFISEEDPEPTPIMAAHNTFLDACRTYESVCRMDGICAFTTDELGTMQIGIEEVWRKAGKPKLFDGKGGALTLQ